eukprot:scaffold3731_cov149-Isochrysis_galbana.AAC.5
MRSHIQTITPHPLSLPTLSPHPTPDDALMTPSPSRASRSAFTRHTLLSQFNPPRESRRPSATLNAIARC